MAAPVITSFAVTKAFDYLLQALKTDTRAEEIGDLKEQLSYTQARIQELEELLNESHDQVRRLVEDCSAEWEWDQ